MFPVLLLIGLGSYIVYKSQLKKGLISQESVSVTPTPSVTSTPKKLTLASDIVKSMMQNSKCPIDNLPLKIKVWYRHPRTPVDIYCPKHGLLGYRRYISPLGFRYYITDVLKNYYMSSIHPYPTLSSVLNASIIIKNILQFKKCPIDNSDLRIVKTKSSTKIYCLQHGLLGEKRLRVGRKPFYKYTISEVLKNYYKNLLKPVSMKPPPIESLVMKTTRPFLSSDFITYITKIMLQTKKCPIDNLNLTLVIQYGYFKKKRIKITRFYCPKHGFLGQIPFSIISSVLSNYYINLPPIVLSRILSKLTKKYTLEAYTL